MYRFGRYLERHYGELFGNFSNKDVYARSTNYSRTILSARCVLAGLLSSTETENVTNLLEDSKFWEYDVQVVPLKEDVLLRSQYCKT